MWYESAAIQGNLVTVMGFVVTKFGLPVIASEVDAGIGAIMVLIGVGYSIYGRIRAKATIR